MRVPELILLEAAGRVGRIGLAAALVALLVPLLALGWLLPQWQAVRELRQAEADAGVQLQRLQRGEIQAPAQPEQQLLDALHRQLPGQPQASALIERLYQLASAARIDLARGEYALGVDPRTQLARYQIVLPLRGSYPQIRGFLKALLGQLPTLVLEDLELQRTHIGERELSGRVRMTLYLSRS